MGRISDTFDRLSMENGKGLVIYLTAGDPDYDTSLELFLCAAASGADILEVGVPFSDPMADGPTIQRAFTRAIHSGATLKKTLSLVRELRKIVDTPIVLFGYINPVIAYGEEIFFKDCKRAGVDGILIVDLPWEEWGEYRKRAAEYGLDWIGLIAPTSGPERTEVIAKDSSGFVYIISVTGITGTRTTIPLEYRNTVRNVKKHVNTPVVVGFGISSPEMAGLVARGSDGVVVGSACIKLIEKYLDDREVLLKKLSAFIEKTKTRLINADI